MSLPSILSHQVTKAIQSLFEINIDKFEFQATRKDFEGDITLVIFPLLKQLKANPMTLGNQIGQYLVDNVAQVSKFNVVSGFLNIVVNDTFYIDFFNEIYKTQNFGFVAATANDDAVMVEYSSPNTNKPLHLGHVRNNLLGYSVAEIIKASGKKVYKTQVINDRGIHICKSMLAWQKYGNQETPESTGLKGDKLVGNYYVQYNNILKSELKEIYRLAVLEYKISKIDKNLNKNLLKNLPKNEKVEMITNAYEKAFQNYLSYRKVFSGYNKLLFTSKKNNVKNFLKSQNIDEIDEIKSQFLQESQYVSNYIFNKEINFPNNNSKKIFEILLKELEKITPIQKEAQQMLLDWEAGKSEVMALWSMMNQWVYDGFEVTYKNLGVDFDSKYYESSTYLLGKDVVKMGLEKGVFEQDADGSVWIDLTNEGLDRKILLRSDGTAVYMTQDIGTAIQRFKDCPDITGMVYTVGNEQDYHFKVLFLVLKKLGFDWAKNLFHLSYGMVELPSGKMKSREGTVVDADDLMVEMTQTAKKLSEDLGKLEGYSDAEKDKLYNTIGLGALKYFMLKVDPKKSMLFNPEESVDFAGNTGPFIQYTYARIQSILRKANFNYSPKTAILDLHAKEKELLKQIMLFPEIIQSAAHNYSPALIANYTYDLVKEYNSFYQTVSILGEADLIKKTFRVQVSDKVAQIIKSSFGLLGIEVPDRM